MHATMIDYLRWMESEGRASTAECYELGVRNFNVWLERHGLDPLRVSFNDLQRFQRYLASEYRSPAGKPLGKQTAATRLTSIKMYYRWMFERGLILIDPAVAIKTPVIRRQRVACDHLTQQEVAAMLDTQAKRVLRWREGTQRWAGELRNLAMLALALASGRRRGALIGLKVEHLDFERNEIRIEWDKGKPGRVLPCAPWALKAAQDFLQRGRAVLLKNGADEGWLFPGKRRPRCSRTHLRDVVKAVQRQTVADNPDLEDLQRKRLGSHGLRVTYATLLFLNGANVRVVNELLMHSKLTTTSRYTPLSLSDLRSAVRAAHPRA